MKKLLSVVTLLSLFTVGVWYLLPEEVDADGVYTGNYELFYHETWDSCPEPGYEHWYKTVIYKRKEYAYAEPTGWPSEHWHGWFWYGFDCRPPW